MDKESIELILPLSETQIAFLMHHLSSNEDKGLVQMCFDIKGKPDREALQSALEKITTRFEVLRTTIHWEKIKKPVLVIHKFANPKINWIATNQIESFNKDLLRKTEKEFSISFSEPGITRLTIFEEDNEKYFGIWTFHHILVDGWSATNLLNALFLEYQNSSLSFKVEVRPLPSIKQIWNAISSIKKNEASIFWEKELGNFQRQFEITNIRSKIFNRKESVFTISEGDQLNALSKHFKKSQATLLQLAWSVTLCKIYQQTDVVYGIVGSGRNLDLPNIDNAAYLLSNTMPFRFNFLSSSVEDNLQQIEQKKIAYLKREHDHLSEIEKWINWQGKSPLVETIFAYANFEWEDLNAGNLIISNMIGDFTSTHAISLILFEDTQLRLFLDYDAKLLTEEEAEKILSYFKSTVLSINNDQFYVNQLNNSDFTIKFQEDELLQVYSNSSSNYAYPTTPSEQLLNEIWQEVLGIHAISIDDDFFELGGTSIQALRICLAIEKAKGSYLNPTILLLNSSIRKLAAELDSQLNSTSKAEESCIVPLKTTGNLPPIFCLHAGEGNILFYRDLAISMSKDIPVYAVQPKPIDENGTLPTTIKAMAEQYYNEISAILKDRPLFIMGMCFSCPICLEIAEMTIADKKPLGAIFIADSFPFGFTTKKNKSLPARLLRIIRERNYYTSAKRLLRRMGRQVGIRSTYEKNRVQLFKILLDYKYEQHDFEIEFLRSSQYPGKENDHHINLWKEIVSEVNVSIIDNSHHTTLFSPESSPRVAKAITQKIEQKLYAI